MLLQKLKSLRAGLVALLACSLFAAACSSATVDVGATDTNTDASEETEVAEDAEAEAPAETTAPTTTATSTTAAPTTTAAPVETTVPAEPAGDSFKIASEHVEYCGIAAEAQVLEQEMGEADFLDPEKLEPFLADNLILLEKARSKVPAEIADDFAVFVAGNYAIENKLADNGFDFLAVVDDPLLNDPEFEAASDAVEAFGETACGFTDGPLLDESETDEAAVAQIEALLATESGRKLFVEGLMSGMGITEEQGFCFIDEVGAEGLAAMANMEDSDDPDNAQIVELFEAFDACGIDPGAL